MNHTETIKITQASILKAVTQVENIHKIRLDSFKHHLHSHSSEVIHSLQAVTSLSSIDEKYLQIDKDFNQFSDKLTHLLEVSLLLD
ncbi:hypothetical protein [Vibrio sp. T11.5]|uniref:hypothetical protein n=1 Tax=Vibrio sp. T11.5 TaxID=2998836 RepID=UPI0022CD57DA|nr:hypothetical protein [Vibrio sp. T11.5]MDA0120282.1 hypothetical protein [Vibrio sp. T11.5]